MPKKTSQRLLVGLDIGTSKVVAIVGELGPDGRIEVVGLGSHPSRGLKKGVVVNIESTVSSIQRAVEEAELMAGCEIHSVYTGIAGSHVRSLNSHGIVAIRDREVYGLDLERVIDAAQAVAIPADQKILHILPQEYVIDNQEGIKEPLGMSGVRLEAKVHLVTCAVNAAQNIEKCIRRCGLEVEEVILEQLASSYSVLTDDERELGVCLVDIGGGTTDIAIFTEGSIRHTGVIPRSGPTPPPRPSGTPPPPGTARSSPTGSPGPSSRPPATAASHSWSTTAPRAASSSSSGTATSRPGWAGPGRRPPGRRVPEPRGGATARPPAIA